MRTEYDPGIVDAEPWEPVSTAATTATPTRAVIWVRTQTPRQSRALSGRVLVLCLLGIAVLVALALVAQR